MPDDMGSGSDQPAGHAATVKKRVRRRRPYGRKPNAYAALDLGTNNCRLLVAKPTGNSFKVIDSYSKVVRLGRELNSTGRLSNDSMDAAVEAIGVCAKKMKNRSVKRWRCIATQACRQAENGEAFLARVKSETGLTLEVISPRVEARLSVMGCVNLIDTAKDVVLVVDIGGGSTELSWVDVRRLKDPKGRMRVHRPPISAWASLPIGVATLSERVPEVGDLGERYQSMIDVVRDEIKSAGCETRFTKAFAAGKGHIIGTSGTITSLASVHLKLPYYQRDKIDGLWMKSDDAVRVARDMSQRSVWDRAKEPSIGEDRASLLVAGCAIIDVLCNMWPSERIRVADRGLREGILMGLMQQSQTLSKPSGAKP